MINGDRVTFFSTLARSYAEDESGATAIEYGLIAALIGVGIIGGLKTLAGDSESMWGELESKVNSEVK